MSTLAAFVALWLFSSSATAQIVSTDCTLTSLYDWTYNSLNQSPCKVGAYLASTCAGGSFTVDPLMSGDEYVGPTLLGGDDICKCNTVFYSLMSACGACQSAFWIDWAQWATNCSRVSAPGTFPNPVPQGTRVPQWALADVTREDLSLWDSVVAMGIGGSPEIGPGELIGGSTTSTGLGPTGTNTGSSPNPTNFPATTTPSPLSPAASSLSASSSSSTSSPSKGSSSNTGAIVGGTVGGVAVIAVAAVVAVFLRRSRSRAPSAAYVVDNPPVAPQPRYGSQNPLSDDGTNVSSMIASETPTTPMRLYDPNDSTTFPGYQGPSPSIPDTPSQSPFTPYSATNSTANMQTSHLQGYSGLPTV